MVAQSSGRAETPAGGRRESGERLPALGRNGEGWVVIQVAFFGVAIVVGMLGASWPESVRSWLVVTGGVAVLAGIVLLLGGGTRLGRQLTPCPRPVAGGELRRDGVFGLVRHPMYGGALVLLLGWALVSSPLALVPLAAAAVFLDAKSRREEAWLVKAHLGYVEYRSQVPRRFLPWVW